MRLLLWFLGGLAALSVLAADPLTAGALLAAGLAWSARGALLRIALRAALPSRGNRRRPARSLRAPERPIRSTR